MSSDTAIQTFALSKRYAVTRNGHKQDFYALRQIDLSVQKGEVLGIIGRNGAGKSTLLKILSRITYPTSGKAIVRGRLSSLLEVGTGFHPELNGRDNVYLNGALLGMTRREIKQQYDAIVAFAGIAEFMETPVKHYSSGMYVRLAFAVAAHLRTDVLLIDEVLAVGDAAFQEKCLRRTEEVRREEGRTVIFVSHNMSAVRHICDRALWIEDGRAKKDGPTEEITADFMRSFRLESAATPAGERTDRSGTGDVILSEIKWHSEGDVLVSGHRAALEINYRARGNSKLAHLNFRLNVFKDNGEYLTTLSSDGAGENLTNLPPEGRVICRFEELPFTAGDYFIVSNVLISGVRTDHLDRALSFRVMPGDRDEVGAMRTLRRSGVRVRQAWTSSDS